MFKLVLAFFLILMSGSGFASPGGLDEDGCHTNKHGNYHCHLKNKAESEKQRLKKLHTDVCGGIAGDNAKPRYDYYGKPCK